MEGRDDLQGGEKRKETSEMNRMIGDTKELMLAVGRINRLLKKKD